jgi:hypothetical protein
MLEMLRDRNKTARIAAVGGGAIPAVSKPGERLGFSCRTLWRIGWGGLKLHAGKTKTSPCFYDVCNKFET